VLHQAERNLKESQEKEASVSAELQDVRAALVDVEQEREAMREDLRSLLEERAVLCDMRHTLSAAMRTPKTCTPLATPARTSGVFGASSLANSAMNTGLLVMGGEA